MEETIELREIIEIILKGKWIISIITIIFVLLAGILSWFILPEKYESKAVVQVASSVQETGIMESFVATEFTPQVYIERLKNETIINEVFEKENVENPYSKSKLNIETDNNTNLVSLTYTSNSPENAQKELKIILESTKNQMNESVHNTLKDLEYTYSKDAESLSEEIESIINEYNTIVQKNHLPEVLILQTILNSEIAVTITGEQIKALANISGTVQNQLLQLQSQIQTKSQEYRNILSKYQSVKTGIENFKSDPFIRMIIEPTLPKGPSFPNHLFNLVIGFVLGIMTSLGFVFLREYWRNSAKWRQV